MNFITPVAMRCNEEQFIKIKPKLLALGYAQICICSDWGQTPYLFTYPTKSCFSNSRTESQKIETWNEKLFLALASMDDSDAPRAGQYYKCLFKDPRIDDKHEVGDVFRIKNKTSRPGRFMDTGLTLDSLYDRKAYRRATVEEIIDHFNQKRRTFMVPELGMGYDIVENPLKFTTSVAIRCDKVLYDKLQKKLLNLGYFERDTFKYSKGLISTHTADNSFSTFPGEPNFWNPIASDEEEFLALAAMSNKKDGFPGEWFIRFDNLALYVRHTVLDERITLFRNASNGNILCLVGADQIAKYLRKATVAEIRTYFSNKRNQDFGKSNLGGFSSVVNDIIDHKTTWNAKNNGILYCVTQSCKPARLKVGDFLPMYLDNTLDFKRGTYSVGLGKFKIHGEGYYQVTGITPDGYYQVPSKATHGVIFKLKISEVDAEIEKHIKSEIDNKRHAHSRLSDENKALINERIVILSKLSEINKQRKNIEIDLDKLRTEIMELEKM